MDFAIRICTENDLSELREISYKTFTDTFQSMNTPSVMEAYLKQAFDREKLQRELLTPGSSFYFLTADGKPAGYLKVNEASAQTDIHDPESLEIERIYVAKDFQGMGLGQLLINKAFEIAIAKKKSYVWLGVWEKNEKAQRFYKKNGFTVIGAHSFFMGEEEQTDYVMRRDF